MLTEGEYRRNIKSISDKSKPVNPPSGPGYKNYYLGEFVSSLKHIIAKEYHDLTEKYDQSVCMYKNDRGIAIPLTRFEIAKCNKNAKEVFNMLCEKYNIESNLMFKYIKKDLTFRFTLIILYL
jgi:hypothetical protein